MTRAFLPLLLLAVASWTPMARAQDSEPIAIGARLELFVDDHLIELITGCSLKLHEPMPAGPVLQLDAPWEGAFSGYFTALKDGDTYRLYYRGRPNLGADGTKGEVTCMAESKDGIQWTKPKLGLHESDGSKENNIILTESPYTHNFAPFLDTNPACPPDQRYKAVAGIAKTGLVAWVSPDGVHWKKLREEGVFRKGAFDSQNVAFWSESEQCYVMYFRVFSEGWVDEKTWKPAGYRTVARVTSKDFINWSEPERMSFGDTPPEHLYTNQTHAYFRAPHLYIGTPMRFMPDRKVLTDEQAASLGVKKGYAGGCAEAVFISSRGGNRYDRTFMEAWIRPGSDLGNWASRAGMTACGVVPTGPAEMSLYKQAHYAQPSAHLLRYTLRTDGFASVNAPYKGGTVVTKPLTFTGGRLTMNFATGATGSVKVAILDEQNKPLPGFTLEESTEHIGDDIARTISWKGGSDVSKLAGKAVKLQFVMKDADLYALQAK